MVQRVGSWGQGVGSRSLRAASEAWARRAAMVLGAAVAVGLFGWSESASGGESAGGDSAVQQRARTTQSEKAERTMLAEAPPSLRAAAIVAMQRGAGPQYDLDLVRDGSGERAYEGELSALGRVLRVDAAGAAIARGYDDEAELGLRLENAGCAGSIEKVAPSEPTAELNRASYARELASGRALEEWYVAGPLGLEQGFTIGESWGCAGEIELDVAVSGARVAAGRRDGELRLVSAASGEQFRYGELAAWDAEGKALTARIEAREGGVRLVVDVAGAVFPVVVDPLVATEQAKLTASDAASNDRFGTSVALSGDTALVSAYLDNDSSGSAYVFVRSGGVWTQQAKLTASDAATGDRFGWSVALSGDTALVGAYTDDDAGINAGSAYVFLRSGGVWTQQAKLTAGDAAADDQFGWSVALSGDTALVGADDEDDGGNDAGSAYVFVRSSGVWTQQAKLTAGDAAAEDRFGASVALSGDTALVGAPSDNNAGGFDAGSAYVFVLSGGAWTQQAQLTAAAEDQFGTRVALSGDTAVVAAVVNNSAYVYVRSSGAWTQEAQLTASDAGVDDAFGASVALSGDTVLVGASFDGSFSGSAYVFLLENDLELGQTCSANGDCASKFCADGVCCNTACGGDAADDCQACSVAAGASADGTCSGTTGNSCEDGSACTVGDTCNTGSCVGGAAPNCNDDAECTDDSCEAADGCTNTPKPDGTPCSLGACEDGECVPSTGPGGGSSGDGGAGGNGGDNGSGGAPSQCSENRFGENSCDPKCDCNLAASGSNTAFGYLAALAMALAGARRRLRARRRPRIGNST